MLLKNSAKQNRLFRVPKIEARDIVRGCSCVAASSQGTL
uniref:Uncharacterized protein n=1 Tax=Arundo donax TaxID=35708 RepID=A0A0A8ZFQ3_ARUDO